MAKRDEFDDEGFFDSLLNRKGKTDLPPGLRRLFIIVGVLAFLCVFIAILFSSIPESRDTVDGQAVPLIRADKSPFRIKPEDPGGMNVPNKDSTIFETLKGEKEGGGVENLLEDEADTASIVPETKTETRVEPVAKAPAPVKEEIPVEETELTRPPVEELEPPQPVAVEEPQEKPPEEKSIIETLKEDTKPPAPVPVPAPKSASPATGGIYIQLAAVKSEAEASQQWAKFKSKNPELSPLTLRVQRADLGAKGIYYRIQAGPLSADAASATCSAVKSRGGTCIIAK